MVARPPSSYSSSPSSNDFYKYCWCCFCFSHTPVAHPVNGVISRHAHRVSTCRTVEISEIINDRGSLHRGYHPWTQLGRLYKETISTIFSEVATANIREACSILPVRCCLRFLFFHVFNNSLPMLFRRGPGHRSALVLQYLWTSWCRFTPWRDGAVIKDASAIFAISKTPLLPC